MGSACAQPPTESPLLRLVAAGEILAEYADEIEDLDIMRELISIEIQLTRVVDRMRERANSA